MKELSLDECSKMVDTALARDRQISPTISRRLAECEQPVKGTTVLSQIVCVLQDYNRDELLEIVAINRDINYLLSQMMKESGLNNPPTQE
jgi:hypothetical protein